MVLTAVVEERDVPGLPVASLQSRSRDIADAAECLAGLALVEGDSPGAISWAHRAVAWSSEARPGCGLVSAVAHHRLGEAALALSKLRIVIDSTQDRSVGCLAAALLIEWGGRLSNDEGDAPGLH